MKTILSKIKNYIINNKVYFYHFLIGFISTLIIGILGFIPGLIGGCIASLGKEAYRANKSKESNAEYNSYLGSSVVGVIIATILVLIV